MAVEFSWHIPVEGDGQWLSTPAPERPPRWDYHRRVALNAEELGFDTILVPTAFSNGQYSLDSPVVDSWTTATAIAAVTQRIRILVAQRPGFINPGVAAMMGATFAGVSGSRLAYNIVTAGAPGDMEMFGDRLEHDARYRRAAEYITLLRRLWTEDRVSFEGEFYRLEEALLSARPQQLPLFYLAGGSPAAKKMAAQLANVYLMSAEPLGDVKQRMDEMRQLAGDLNPSLRFGIAGTIICRDTHEQAWAQAQAMLERADPAVLKQRMGSGHHTTSVEDQLFRRRGDLRMANNLWAGMSHLAYGSAYVGAPDDLAAMLQTYIDAGISMIQFYGFPDLEEAERVARQVVAPLRHANT
ncbi:MAG TPA: LLM class flavin-dependent oxidoreductase [Chloroflexota bacterium]|nr:LLM class flavin-dependent oxidoreductase [Chloroflexota bacterium]